MNKFYQLLGRTAYYASKPWQWAYLARNPRSYILIEHNGKFLVVLNWLGKGDWGLPGGGLHPGEDPRAGAVREALEETGITISEEDLKKSQEFFTKYVMGGKHYTIFHVVLDSEPSVVRRKAEILNTRWMTKAELQKVRIREEVASALKVYAQNLV